MSQRPDDLTQEQLEQAAVTAAGGLFNTVTGGSDDSGFWDIDFNMDEFLQTVSLGVYDPYAERDADPKKRTPAEAVAAVEKKMAATQRIIQILEAANIDPTSSLTATWLAAIDDTPAGQLAFIAGPGGKGMLEGFLEMFPDAALVRSTPYSVALEEQGFAPAFTQVPGAARYEAVTGKGVGPGYEYSDKTGAIRFPNGTIVTAEGGIIYDPEGDAPGSPQYLRNVAESWDEQEIARWKARLVTYGYLPKEIAKAEGFTAEFRDALSTYWNNYYVAGGKPIRSAQAEGAATELPPLID